ncbi:MAG TPA: extracellular solute-binding protein [bacterium]|nr:extracellular solute-binding protein [bacterium]
MKKVIFLLLACFSLLFISGFGCKKSNNYEKIKESLPQIELNYWRATDEPSDFSELIEAYQKDHPNVTIRIRNVRLEEYRQLLTEAWADDRGPDIFSIPSTWVGEFLSKNKLQEMPESTTMMYEVVINAEKNEREYQSKTDISPTLRDIKTKFIDVVYPDVVRNDKIYALPLAIDTLVLYYNRDLLNNDRIAEPALDWTQFKEDVKKLTITDKKGNIFQSGTSLGLVDNVENAFDIVSLLMMQNGSSMECGDSFCIGGSTPDGRSPGMDALVFYTDFANPYKDVYSWNKDMPNSLEAFADGKVAYFLGYAYQNEQIKARNPSLNYYISTVPQIEGTSKEVNFASYYVEVVSKKGQHQNEAWDFVKYITNEKNVTTYLNKTKKPTAIRSLIKTQEEDPDMAPFAKQLLTAKNWYHGRDFESAKQVLNNLVIDVLNSSEGASLKELEQDANEKLNITW